jgi:hypothetical protein
MQEELVMSSQEKSSHNSHSSISEEASSTIPGQNPMLQRPDSGSRLHNFIRDGNKTYEAFADEYMDQGP